MTDSEAVRETWEESVLERLLSLKRNGESDAAFARRLGLQPQHLSNYRSGRHTLSLQTAVRISRRTGLSLDWLLRGEGEPCRGRDEAEGGDEPTPVQELRRHSAALREKARQLQAGGRLPDDRVVRLERTLEEVIEVLAS